MIVLLLLLTGIVVWAEVLLIIFWLGNFRSYHTITTGADHVARATHAEFVPLAPPVLQEHPPVAILLAVRNEAQNLTACLNHLLAQDYPPEKITIWIGNDASTDNTLAIAQGFAAKEDRIRVIDIQHNLSAARAKANVIAHLAQANAGAEHPADFLLVTDADIRTPSHWIQGMLHSWQISPCTKKTGIITGVTLVQKENLWAVMQRLDWLFALGMVKITSDLGIPTATLGNNMMMTREAYEATGGYESLPFSITEDFQILQEITRRGYGFRNVIHQQVAVFTLPMVRVVDLLQQRKRWMHGAIRLPWPIVTLLFLQALFFPFTIVLAWWVPFTALLIYIVKVLLQSFFIVLVIEKIKFRPLEKITMYIHLFFYDLYAAVIGFLTIFYYYLPFKTLWKNRSFE